MAVLKVVPLVFAGEHVPTAVGMLLPHDPTHWKTAAGTIGDTGGVAKWFVIVAVQITAPAKKPETLHCWTVVTGDVEIVVVVVHVPPPARITGFVPRHRVIVTVEAGDADSAPVEVT